MQGCVSRLRKALGSAAIATSSTGYRLVLHRDDFVAGRDLTAHEWRTYLPGREPVKLC